MPFDGAASPLHWLIVAFVALMVIGPDKLPDAARKAATGWRELRAMYGSLLGEVRDVADELIPPELRGRPPVGDPADTSPPSVAPLPESRASLPE